MTPTASAEQQHKTDKKKMEGDAIAAGLNTLQCLRGRLLAERQASKVAKEEAQLLGNKLIEIEIKLAQETKLRLKAEKKLKLLLQKLHGLNLLPTLELQSASSEISTSSSTEHQPAFNAQLAPNNRSALPLEESSTTQLRVLLKDSLPSCQDSQSCSNLEAPVDLKLEKDVKDNEENVDNSMALVPVAMAAATTKTRELIIVDKSVGEVLDDLRHAREKIQGSIQSRSIIRVGTA